MSLQVEKLEKNMAKLTIEAPADEFEKAVEKSYQKNKNRMSVPGFRKGKVPRKMLEKMYGTQIFFEDAINDLIPEVYSREVTAACGTDGSGSMSCNLPDSHVWGRRHGESKKTGTQMEKSCGKYPAESSSDIFFPI